MAEKKESKKALGSEDWNKEHAALREALKKAQQDLWDHVHPVIESAQDVADQKAAEEKKSAAKSAPKAEKK